MRPERLVERLLRLDSAENIAREWLQMCCEPDATSLTVPQSLWQEYQGTWRRAFRSTRPLLDGPSLILKLVRSIFPTPKLAIIGDKYAVRGIRARKEPSGTADAIAPASTTAPRPPLAMLDSGAMHSATNRLAGRAPPLVADSVKRKGDAADVGTRPAKRANTEITDLPESP
ncbi:hypothetical protein LTR36_006175 [Oleoguttula mirabilis]|uniref:Uncharacterized protein n=1 Tax=Oleoguttula mirabilis TaxID=1507867 RepID=A0AAV9JD91_9PEZI|nr:hypothetical protein LTR36_006175 [Oleoguttula mirabilis]